MERLPPTTKHRRGRRTPRQERALAAPGPALLTVETLTSSSLLHDVPVVLDIGFGTGEAVIAMAQTDPDVVILAADTHTPGVGDLLASLQESDIPNVSVIEADARHVLEALPPGSLTGVRTFFPDPWPKKRHHRRRLITTGFAELVATRAHPGAFWHIATDWADYAEHIGSVMQQCDAWEGGVISKPPTRPTTRYERRGIAAGRQPIDLWFERTPQ